MTLVKCNILLTAGGTGGHLHPAEALAEELDKRGCKITLITDARGQHYKAMTDLADIHVVRWRRPSGGIFNMLRSSIEFIGALNKCRKIIRRVAPDLVVGFGGYPSLPTMAAAEILRLPTLIHEQNAVLGRVNRLLSPYVSGIATCFDSIKSLKSAYFKKVRNTGNPVRHAVVESRKVPYRSPHQNGLVTVLCIGGSQGASIFGKVLPYTITLLKPNERKRLRLWQQCRVQDVERVSETYKKLSLDYQLSPFFENIADRMHQSHLLITRAGASTLSELAVSGRPAILVPYAHAKDDHQTANANAIAERGGGWLLHEKDFTPEKLTQLLRILIAQPDRLAKAAKAARAYGVTDAAERLADMALSLTGKVAAPQDPKAGEAS